MDAGGKSSNPKPTSRISTHMLLGLQYIANPHTHTHTHTPKPNAATGKHGTSQIHIPFADTRGTHFND